MAGFLMKNSHVFMIHLLPGLFNTFIININTRNIKLFVMCNKQAGEFTVPTADVEYVMAYSIGCECVNNGF